jgi:hypothetical protein
MQLENNFSLGVTVIKQTKLNTTQLDRTHATTTPNTWPAIQLPHTSNVKQPTQIHIYANGGHTPVTLSLNY